MKLKDLKDNVLMGTENEKESFVSSLKARCVQPSDKSVMVNGVEEQLYSNSADNTFFDRFMTVYRVCPVCHSIEPISNFTECTIHPENRYRHEGERSKRVSEIACNNCINSGNFIVPYSPIRSSEESGDYWVYRHESNTVRILDFDDNDNFVYRYTINRSGQWFWYYKHYYAWDYENDNFADDIPYFINNCLSDLLTNVYIIDSARRYYRVNRYPFLKTEVEAHPETWAKCTSCGRIWHRSKLNARGRCRECVETPLWDCPRWPGVIDRKHSPSENVDEHSLYFGLKIKVEKNLDEIDGNLLDPIFDIFHLEKYIDNKIRMVSQPMTLAYLRENYDRIKAVFKSLRNEGYKADEVEDASMEIFTLGQGYIDNNAIRRAIVITHAFRSEMRKLTREDNKDLRKWQNVSAVPTDHEILHLIKDNGLYAVSYNNDCDNPKVAYEFFHSTLNPDMLMADIELVNNIVKMANSTMPVVRFGDLLNGVYIQQYVEDLEKQGVEFDRKQFVCFGYNAIESNIVELVKGNINANGFAANIKEIFELSSR